MPLSELLMVFIIMTDQGNFAGLNNIHRFSFKLKNLNDYFPNFIYKINIVIFTIPC